MASAFFHKHLAAIASLEFLVIIVLAAVLVEPYLVNRPQAMDMTTMSSGMMQKLYNTPDGSPAPTLDFVLTKDAVGGYDIHAVTTNFTFTPELINTAPEPDAGHIHLYIDGTLTIMLGPWYHINSLSPGKHVIMMSLNENDHSELSVNWKPVEIMKTVYTSQIQ